MKIKKDDNVIVLTGKYKGKTGKVIKSMPKEDRIVVSGINMYKKNQRPTKQGQKGQVIEKNGSIHISNVALVGSKKSEKTKTVKK
ncbi:MAG: 50S ribosomal protein L24 [Patescibacteria group bacterium]